MAEFSILNIEFKDNEGHEVWVNPAHIVKVVRMSPAMSVVHLTNGDTYAVDLYSAKRIKEYFENSQKKLL